MTVYDKVKKETLELDVQGMIQKMKDGRQVDLEFTEKQSDEDGYMKWDIEHWSTVDSKRFIRTYTYKGRELGEYTGHNMDDLLASFHPEAAAKVTIS